MSSVLGQGGHASRPIAVMASPQPCLRVERISPMILSDDGAFTAAYPLPHSVDELTAAWLTYALRERFPAVTVEAVEIVQVIRGTATKVRLRAHYAGGAVTGGPPETLCVKGGLDDRWRVKALTRVVKLLGLFDPAK